MHDKYTSSPLNLTEELSILIPNAPTPQPSVLRTPNPTPTTIMPSRSSALIPEWKWEKHKMRIWHFVLIEKLTPGELCNRMKELGLDAT